MLLVMLEVHILYSIIDISMKITVLYQ